VAKALKTRQKLMFRADGLRPRNPVAVAARKRQAGPHGPSKGGARQMAKRRFRRQFGET